jgi:trehalose-phosphatase
MEPGGEVAVDELVARYAPAIAAAEKQLEPLVLPLDGVVLEDKTWTLSLHYRGADESIVPLLHAVVQTVAREHGLLVTNGKKVFEIRPPVPIDKGIAVERLITRLESTLGEPAVLFAGDDVTDEDAFRMLREKFPTAVTIHVGTQVATSAEFRFESLAEVRVLLERLATHAKTR